MYMYNDKIMEHFMCPQNGYYMVDADGEGEYGDPCCGDNVTVYIKVSDDIIEEISYLVFGCACSIATSSMLSILAKGKNLAKALEITCDDVDNALGGLPEEKKHCSNLGVGALKYAIEDYLYRRDNYVGRKTQNTTK